MRWTTWCTVLLALGLIAAGCPPESEDDDDTGDDDTSADDDTGDDDTGEWPGTFEIVRVCGSSGGDPGDPGPDIDSLELRRDASLIGSATTVVADNVATSGNAHADAGAAVGAQDGNYVSIGPVGHYLDLTFGSEGEMEPGDVITLWEVTDGSGEDETYRVLVSASGAPGTWVNTETAVGAYAVVVHGPSYFMEGCEG